MKKYYCKGCRQFKNSFQVRELLMTHECRRCGSKVSRLDEMLYDMNKDITTNMIALTHVEDKVEQLTVYVMNNNK